MAPSGPLHPTLLLLAVAAAGLALLVAGRRRSQVGAGDLGALLGALVLAATGTASIWLVVAVGVAGLARPAADLAPPARRRALAVVVAGAAVAVARCWPGFPISVALVAAVSVVVLGPAAVVMPARRPRWLPVGLLVGVVAAAWAGGPDTEGPLVAAAVLAPTLLAERRRPTPAPWFAPVVLVAWAAADAYRGRPAGLPGPLVALAILGAAIAATGAVTHRTRARAIVAAGLAADAVAARTIGLATDLGGAGVVAGAASALVLVAAAGVLVARGGLSEPEGARPEPADGRR